MASGKYNQRFIRLIGTITQEGTYGGLETTYLVGETLWGYYAPIKSLEKVQLEQVLGRADIKIVLHNAPVIADIDLLKDKTTGELYHVVGDPIEGDNEVIVTCWQGENDNKLVES